MDKTRRQYFKDTFFSTLNKDIPWNEEEKLRNELTTVLDEFDQEASLEDIHTIFSIPENTYDADTLKKAVAEATFPGHVLLALYGTLSGLGVEETNLRELDVGRFWGYVAKHEHCLSVGKSAYLPRSIGKMTNVENVQLCIDHYGSSGVRRFPKELCNWINLKVIDFLARDFSSYSEVSWETFIESWPNLEKVVVTGHWRDSNSDHMHFLSTAKRIRPNCTGWVSIPSD